METTMTELIKMVADDNNETIIAIVIGDAIDDDEKCIPNYEKQPRNKVLLPNEETFKWLNYNINTAYAEGNAIYVWTTNSILFISTHDDNSMWLRSMPRFPHDCEPITIDG